MGKVPDAKGVKKDLLKGAGRNQSQYQARGHKTAVRGNAEAKSREHEQGSKPGNPINIKHQEELKLKGEGLANQRK